MFPVKPMFVALGCLMEMANRRENVNANAEGSSHIYCRSWIYDELGNKKEVEMVNIIEEERETTRKVIIIAFCCMQVSHNNWPLWSWILNMLEGKINKLQLHPKPLLYPIEMLAVNLAIEIET